MTPGKYKLKMKTFAMDKEFEMEITVGPRWAIIASSTWAQNIYQGRKLIQETILIDHPPSLQNGQQIQANVLEISSRT